MRFLAFSTQAGWALLAAVAGAILLLYLLKPRRRRIVVASNLIWRRIAARRRFKTERWRWMLSWLLASAIGLCIALALTRPEVAALGGISQRHVLMLDNSPSMAARTRDGASRFDKAAQRARKLIQSAALASEFMVLDTMGQAGIAGFQGRDAALAQLTKLTVASFGTARMPRLPAELGASFQARLWTDGVAPLGAPSGIVVESVFEPADNVAITAFDARAEPNDPARYTALVQLYNASPVKKSVKLEVSGAPRFSEVRDVELEAGQKQDLIIDVSAFEAGVLRAVARSDRDALGRDDAAYAVVAAHAPRKLLLVSAGNRALEAALKLLPGIELTSVKPADFSADARADLYLFDGFAPQQAPAAPVLGFGMSTPSWLATGASVDVRKPSVTRWNARHPLAAELTWTDLRIGRAALAPIDAGDGDGAPAEEAIVLAKGAQEGALVNAGTAPVRWIRVGFALQDSNLAHQAGFTVFLGRALDWLDPRREPAHRTPGMVELPWPDAAVTDQDGKAVALTVNAANALFEARRPGVYTISRGVDRQQWVVDPFDTQRAELNRSRFNAPSQPSAPAVRAWPFELWSALLLVAALLLLIEWLSFSRRLTN